MSASLSTRRVEKPWGREVLPAPFADVPGKRIGEIWFEPPHELEQLLVKYIFTSENLSVQVHPSDAQLPGHGKEECWLIVDAEPGAEIGIGFRETVAKDSMRKAAIDGSIERLLAWHSVRRGDFFYIPANTVHAIGAGVCLIEIQQNSDVTYRLYDYGRPRELHLDKGIEVACGGPYPRELHRHVPPRGSFSIVDGPLFRLDQVDGEPGSDLASRYAGPLLLIPREGPVHVAGEEIAAGECALAEGPEDVAFANSGICLLAQPCKS